MKKPFYLILLFVSLIFFKCNQTQKKLTQTNRDKSKLEQRNTVVFNFSSKDSIAKESIQIINENKIFGSAYKRHNEIQTDSTLIFEIEPITETQLLDISFFNKDFKFYNSFVYTSPGDTINIRFNKKIEFFGEKEKENNLLYELYNTPELDYIKNPYKGNIINYKHTTKTLYKNRLDLVTENSNERNINNPEFLTLLKDVLKFEYLYNLVCPRMNTIPTMENSYFNSLEGLKNTVENEYFNKETFFNYSEYFDHVSLEDFKNVGAAVYTSAYKSGLVALIRYHFETSGHEPFTNEKFDKEVSLIEKELKNELYLKNYIAARIIWDYSGHGFGFSQENIKSMNNLINKYDNAFKQDSTSYETLSSIQEDLNSFNHEVSEFALDSKLKNLYGEALSLKDVLNKPSKKIKVIIFWASWCAPCIDEITKSKLFRDQISIRENIEWIYLSIDKDEMKWLSKSKELNHFLNVRHQYLLTKGKESAISKYLKVELIPRYIILDQKNKIRFNNAPRPSDNEVFAKVIKSIK